MDAEASKLVRATLEMTLVVDGVQKEVKYTLADLPLSSQANFQREGSSVKDHVSGVSYRSWWLSEGKPGTWGSQEYTETDWTAALPPMVQLYFLR